MRPRQGFQPAAIANRPKSQGAICFQDALSVVGISVLLPTAATYVNAAARAEGSAAAVRHQAKHAQYEHSDSLGYAFVPLSTETFGRLVKPGMALLNKLDECALARGIAFKDGIVANVFCDISVFLCRVNSVFYQQSIYALAFCER